MTAPVSMRTRFLRLLLEQAGQPYQWGGKGPMSSPHYFGFDCSGLVTWALHAAMGPGSPDWRETHNANTLLHALPPPRLQVLRGGELVFYGKQGAYAERGHCVCGAEGPVHPDCVAHSGARGFANADHVMIYLGGGGFDTDKLGNLTPTGGGLLWGACGGGHTTTTREAAAAMPDGGARVRSREGLDYRSDRIALRDIRFPDEM